MILFFQEGEVLFIDLISGDVLSEATVPESITGIELVQDDRQSITYALVSTGHILIVP